MTWAPSPYLMGHQARAAALALDNDRFGFFHDTGTGKTALGIELIKQKNVKTLVVCPLSIITNAWMADLQKFAPEIKAVNLWDLLSRKQRIPEHQVAVLNFERFRTANGELPRYEMVLIDESSKIKSVKSQITKRVIKYCDSVPYVYLFSGTPAPNSELEYWPQMRVIDPSLFGRSFYSWRNRYCYSTGYGGYTWKLRSDLMHEFLDKLSSRSEVVRKEDVLDLPERTFNIRDVYLSDPEMKAYRQMENDLIVEFGDQESIATTAMTKVMKLRQGSSGFFYTDGSRPIISGTSKLDALTDLVREIGSHQVVIWYQFRQEGDQIMEALHNVGRVDGSISTQGEKDETIRDFIAGRLQYLIAHPSSLGHGVTLTNCNYAIYYSLSHSHELHYQSQDRIYRNGQRNACTYYFLIAHRTVDAEILKALHHKADVAESVFQYLKRERGNV